MGGFRNRMVVMLVAAAVMAGCASGGGKVVNVTTVSDTDIRSGLEEDSIKQLEDIQKSIKNRKDPYGLTQVMQKTPNYSVEEYLKLHAADPKTGSGDYRVGGLDVLDVSVYEEADLSRKDVRVSADGYISFPLIGRLKVDQLTTGEIETAISRALAEGGYMHDAHVSVVVADFKSKQYMVLGSVRSPGTYSLSVHERVLDGISRAGGIDFDKGGSRGVIIRTENPGTPGERKVVIRIDLPGLLKGDNQLGNLYLEDKDLLYVPAAEMFYILGQVEHPGSFPFRQNDITVVEAISMAGGFTRIASRNKTRIVRVEDGVEKIIVVRVDQITDSGRKFQDIVVKPGDVIVVPESMF